MTHPDYEGHAEAEHFSDQELVGQSEMLIVQSIVAGDSELISLDGKRHLHLRQVPGGVALTIEHAQTAEGTDLTEQVRFEDGLAFSDFDIEVTNDDELTTPEAPEDPNESLEEKRERIKDSLNLSDGQLERGKLMEIYADLATAQIPED